MEKFDINMSVESFQRDYERVVNCVAVKVPYEKEGTFSGNFFMDKRPGLAPDYFNADHELWISQDFLDSVDVNGRRYYLYKEGAKVKVGTFTDPIAKTGFVSVTPAGFDYSGCDSLLKGRGPVGPIYNVNIGAHEVYQVIAPTEGTAGSKDFPSIPGYSGGYVKFKYDGSLPLSAGQLITFRDGVLRGATLRIELVEGTHPTQDVYVIGANSRGSLPWLVGSNTGTGANFDVFGTGAELPYGSTILVGHQDGVTMLVVDGANEAHVITLLETSKPVIDMAKFGANLYVMTEDRIHYSESIVYGDTNFYPLDSFPVNGGESIFPIGKAMIVFGNENMIVSTLEGTDGSKRVVGYPLRYAGKPYSKKSYAFSDKTILVLQKDKQLMELDIVQNDSVTFDVQTKNAMPNSLSFFSDLPGGGTVRTSVTSDAIRFVLSGTASTSYRFDKQVKSWFRDQYPLKVNAFKDDVSGVGTEALTKESISTLSGYSDFDTSTGLPVDYEQYVSFTLNAWPNSIMAMVCRTQFGLPDVALDLTFSAEFELGAKKDIFSKRLTGFPHDTRLSESETGDELPGLGTVPKETEEYDGNVASVQNWILKTGRFSRYSYYGNRRFVIGPSTVFAARTKQLINEPIFNG